MLSQMQGNQVGMQMMRGQAQKLLMQSHTLASRVGTLMVRGQTRKLLTRTHEAMTQMVTLPGYHSHLLSQSTLRTHEAKATWLMVNKSESTWDRPGHLASLHVLGRR